MSRTYRTPEDKRRPYYTKEGKQARKTTSRKARYDTKRALRTESDDYPQYRGTCGWLTH